MRAGHETLDEAIDRVAASLTAMPVDVGFVARLDARLDARSPRTRGLWLVAASATSALILAAVMVDRSATTPIAIDPPRVAAADPTPPPRAVELVEGAAPADGRIVRVKKEPAPTMLQPIPQVAALDGPQSLSVDALLFGPLTIEPVEEPEVLALPDLEVRAIDAGADHKEY